MLWGQGTGGSDHTTTPRGLKSGYFDEFYWHFRVERERGRGGVGGGDGGE